jgi:hypothetical protein
MEKRDEQRDSDKDQCRCGQEPSNAAKIKVGHVYAAQSFRFSHQHAGNEKAGDDEEYVDSDVASAHHGWPQMKENDRGHAYGTESLYIRSP